MKNTSPLDGGNFWDWDTGKDESSMFLQTLSLKNFRNYSDLKLDFKSPTTVLIGNNAQGKSNLLESIYFLATTKSSKATKDEELIKQDQTSLAVTGHLDSLTTLEITMQKLTNSFGEIDFEETSLSTHRLGGVAKRVKVNGINRRVVDYIGNLSVVLFSPEDINLVTSAPSLRRWHLDLTLAQINSQYKTALTHYGEVITKKNRILKRIKEGLANLDELDFWSEEQLELGQLVTLTRQKLFEFINKSERQFGNYAFEYVPNLITPERLHEYRAREVAAAASLIGPHRDDFRILLDNHDLKTFGSRGQHRMGILDLKLSESLFIHNQTEEQPLLLLDDIFSELDQSHRNAVAKLFSKQQLILVAVELDSDLRHLLSQTDSQVLKVDQASVSAL